MADARPLLEPIRTLHESIRDAVVAACEAQESASLAAVDHDGDGDTIYAIDRVSEDTLLAGLAEVARLEPMWVVAEGLPPAGIGLPDGVGEAACRWRVLVDPIDGTRGLMYQKRSAWVLTGVAPNRGASTRLRDIVLAVQTEIPLVKQHLSDQLWALRGQGAWAQRHDRLSGAVREFTPHPSRADTIAHGFSSVVRFFPGARDVLGAIDDALVAQALGPPLAGKAACFEDQYMSTGGQLYELAMGHDRFVADLRPEMASILAARGFPLPLCCHPYDLCTALVAEQLGVVVTDADGAPMDGPFDLDANLSWVGYANAGLRDRVEPALQDAVRRLARGG